MVGPNVRQPTGRYRLLSRIGVGGMGEVFLAHDTMLDRNVVIKHLKPELSADLEFVAMFLDEARAVARSEHPNIVKIFDLGLEDGRYFMALEWLEGWDLQKIHARLNKQSRLMPLPILVGIFCETAEGLDAAHNARTADGRFLNLVHRDVSPHNLCVTTDGVVKVLDFGLARMSVQRRQTVVGTIRGKSGYMSPEQYQGEQLDRRSDIFSLGVVFYELLTGERLFRRDEARGEYLATVSEPILPPVRKGESIPEPLVALVMRALQRDPGRRHQTARELVDALQPIAEALGVPVGPDDVATFLAETFPEGPTVAQAPAGGGTIDDVRYLGSSGQHSVAGLLETTVPDSMTAPASDRAGGVTPSSAPGRVGSDSADHRQTMLLATEAPPSRSHLRPWLWWGLAGGSLVALAIGGVVLVAGGGDQQPDAADGPASIELEGIPLVGSPPMDETVGGDVSAAASPVLVDPPGATDESLNTNSAAGKIVRDKRSPAPAGRNRPVKGTRGSRAGQRDAHADRGASATGRLTLQSFPWANVYVDGKLVGPTPLVNHALPVGTVKVRLINPDLGLEKVESIRILSGKTVRRRIELSD